jgi:hypothetical protein
MAYRTKAGTRVTTADKLDGRDYAADARLARRPAADGAIVGSSDSHGLCYKVLHEDGTEAYYDPDELLSEGVPLSVDHAVDEIHES